MKKRLIINTKRDARAALSFLVPTNSTSTSKRSKKDINIAVIIPTYRPNNNLYRLTQDIIKYNPNIKLVIVNDSTPKELITCKKVFAKIKNLQKSNKNITLLTTPSNSLKAGALNFGLSFVFSEMKKVDVIFTADDDIAILPDTFFHMIKALSNDKKLGAVCSIALVKNKNKNLLTRIQGLEYHSFNITKVADTGFLHGPLVMQGMLTAFRAQALKKVNGFSTDKLIEDYDITVRIKNAGWKTGIATEAIAWTDVPESISGLWKQRIRWSYGGIIVVKEFWKNIRAIFQDIMGHTLFLTLFSLVVLSFLFSDGGTTSNSIVMALFILAVAHFILSFSFSVISLATYKDKDRIDWVIKLSLVPEFIYSNILNLVLFGSYIYFLFNSASKISLNYVPRLKRIQRNIEKSFHLIGYSSTWGTRN